MEPVAKCLVHVYMSKSTNDRLKSRFLLTKNNCIYQLITNKSKQHTELYHPQPCMSIKSPVSASLQI